VKQSKSNIAAGDLKDFGYVEKFVGVADDTGGAPDDWTAVTEAWARITPYRGGDPRIGQQLQSQTTHVIDVRYDPRIVGEMRYKLPVSIPGRTARLFKIVYVSDIEERHEFMSLFCEEGGHTN
jgi:SPP1 family predicted phage head-tail adaptor